MTWARIRAEARRSGNLRQRTLQSILDQYRSLMASGTVTAVFKARKLYKRAMYWYKQGKKVSKALVPYQVRHYQLRMSRFIPNIGYWGGKLLTDSLKDIKRHRNTSKYVERKSDQIMRPPRRPKAPRKRGYVRSGTAPPRYPLTRKSSKKRTKTASGSYYKSKKKKRYASPKGITNIFDDHNEFTDDTALYICQQDFGSTDRAISIGVQAVVKACLATMKAYPQSVEDTFAMPDDAQLLRFQFRRLDSQQTDQNDTSTVGVDGRTFNAICLDVTTIFRNRLADGYLPTGFQFMKSSSTTDICPMFRQLGSSMIYFSAKTMLRLQNTTHSDGFANNAHDSSAGALSVEANPLKGKVYSTNGMLPYVKDGLIDVEPSLLSFHQSNTYGIFKGFDPATGTSTLNHPPLGNAFFKYCKGSRNVSMKPGAIMPLRSSFTCKMKVTDYFKKVAGNLFKDSQGPHFFGKCTVVALEQLMRSSADEGVHLGVNRELTMRASCVLKTRVPTLSTYLSSDVPAT